MALSAGDLTDRITIQQPVTIKTAGVSTTTWNTFKSGIWASIKTLKSYERASAQATWPGADYKVTIRYLRGLTGNMRLIDDRGMVYTILGQPNDVDRRHEVIEMMVQSGVKAS
jgi:SPP1 family predicted phage head-tail adaptor